MTHLAALNVHNTSRVDPTGKPRTIPGTVGESLGSLALCVALTSLAASGCAETDKASEVDEADGSQPAVVIGNRVCTAEECAMYLGAFPEVPSGELDRATMREFGALVYVTLFEGRVYSYERESGTLTKFVITSDFRLEAAGELSFAAFGAADSPAYSQVASATRAFSYLRSAQTIVVWNPSTMEVEREIPTPEIVRDGVALELNPPVLAAGRVQWPVKWVDYDKLRFDSHAAVLAVDTDTLAVEILEDPRAAVTSVLHATESGDTLVLSDNYSGFFNLFGEAAGTTSPEAVLRVRAGGDFDSEYRVDLRTATGSPAVYGGWFLGDNAMLLRVWDPDVDPSSLLTDPNDYWSAEEYISMMLVDLMSGTAEPFAVLPRGGAGSTGDLTEVDGKVYISVYSEGGGRTEMFAVTPAGAEPAFSTLGDVLFMGRAR
jgi:hypothetical protein